MLAEIEGKETLRVAGDPISFHSDSRGAHHFPPKLGENTLELLQNPGGMDPEDVQTLLSAGGAFAARS
jgi:crotonobetainyl-CoA:carnitine CoA-transferase CaiB-like acyl-CoA transferase